MSHAQLVEIASTHLGLAALHHVTAAVLAAIWWQRRRELGRAVTAYLAVSFLTTSWAMRGPLWPLAGAPALVLAGLWARETVRPKLVVAFARTPRPRLMLAAVGAAVALVFPGYSGELPTFIFSPLGVLIAPTVLLALTVVSAVDATEARMLAGVHAVAGAAYGITEALAGGPSVRGAALGVVMLLLAGTAALVAAGRLRALPAEPSESLPRETSVEQIRSRLYERKTLLPGPRDPRRRGSRFGKRK